MSKQVPMDRRSQADRRTQDQPVATERRKVSRRRQIDPTTCERDYSNDEIEFMRALDEYKRRNGRMFPTCSEILEVIRDLGYVRLEIEGDESDMADGGADAGRADMPLASSASVSCGEPTIDGSLSEPAAG